MEKSIEWPAENFPIRKVPGLCGWKEGVENLCEIRRLAVKFPLPMHPVYFSFAGFSL